MAKPFKKFFQQWKKDNPTTGKNVVKDNCPPNNLHLIIEVWDFSEEEPKRVNRFSVNFLDRTHRVKIARTAWWANHSGYVMITIPKSISPMAMKDRLAHMDGCEIDPTLPPGLDDVATVDIDRKGEAA